MSTSDVFKMPKPVKITGRSSSITNSFVNGIIPIIKPTEAEIKQALDILEMNEENICCAYCGDHYTEWDHLRPLVIGKTATGYISEIHNLVPSCGKCNQSKGNRNWKEWMFSNATHSPKSRNISDIYERSNRLSKYEEWESPLHVDFESIVGKYKWQQHWENCENIKNLMKQSQVLSDEIKDTILKALNSKNEELSRCFGKNTEHINSEKTINKSSNVQNYVQNYNPLYIDKNKKIGQLVQQDFTQVLNNKKVNEDILNMLQKSSYSKQFFDVNYPILIQVNSDDDIKNKGIDHTGRNRYYANPIIIQGKKYLLTSQWFDRSKEKLIYWMQKYR